MPCFFSRIIHISLLCFLFLAACVPVQVDSQVSTPVPLASSTVTQQLPMLVAEPSRIPAEATPTIQAGCNASTGKLDRGVITTALLDKPMRYMVYLPPCYAYDSATRYPVLYLLHGQGFTEEQWIRIGAVSTADRLISSAETPPFIMVFPFDYSYKQPDEYNYEDVFIHSLVPLIDATYRTLPVASRRAIGGLSRGGAWALHIGIGHPDLFGAVGGHSSVIFFADNKSILRKLREIPLAKLPRIWLDIGESDSDYTVMLSFEDFLDKNNIPHEWHTFVGWHDEKYWSAHINTYLSWYAQAWR